MSVVFPAFVRQAVVIAAWLDRHALAVVIAFVAATIAVIGPFATNDGPVHMSFARTLWWGFDGPTQAALYERRLQPVPNLIGYLLAGPLLPMLGPDGAEAILQALCLVALPLGGTVVAAAFGTRGGPFPGLFGVLGMNRLFVLGLYNFCLSLGFALAAFGAAVRALRGQHRWWWVLAGALAATVVSHGGGLMLAVVLIAGWTLPVLAGDLAQMPSVAAAARRYVPLAVAVLPTAAFVVAHAALAGPGRLDHGPGLGERLGALFDLYMFALHGPRAGAAPGVALLVLSGLALLALVRRWQRAAQDRTALPAAASLILIPGGTLALYLIFPDEAGGGWDHSKRLLVMFWVTVAVIAATEPLGRTLRHAATVLATLSLAGVLAAALADQRDARAAVNEADRLLETVPRSCEIVPLITEPRNVGTRQLKITYEPLFQIATRAEHSGDRVVLFNYLARLGPYPTQYRAGMDPHGPLFGWLPEQRSSAIRVLDIGRYETTTGRSVDYVFVQGERLDRIVLPPDFTEQFVEVAASPWAGMRLFRRIGLAGQGSCP